MHQTIIEGDELFKWKVKKTHGPAAERLTLQLSGKHESLEIALEQVSETMGWIKATIKRDVRFTDELNADPEQEGGE